MATTSFVHTIFMRNTLADLLNAVCDIPQYEMWFMQTENVPIYVLASVGIAKV